MGFILCWDSHIFLDLLTNSSTKTFAILSKHMRETRSTYNILCVCDQVRAVGRNLGLNPRFIVTADFE